MDNKTVSELVNDKIQTLIGAQALQIASLMAQLEVVQRERDAIDAKQTVKEQP